MDLMALYKFEETLKVVNTDKKEKEDISTQEESTEDESDESWQFELRILPEVTSRRP